MQELIPPRRQGETAIYEEDPFGFGEIDEGDLILVENFLPSPENFILKEPETEGIEVIIKISDELISYPV